MRTLFSWRLWAALLALLGAALIVRVTTRQDAVVQAAAVPVPDQHRIEFASWVYLVEASPDFAVINGVARGTADLVIDGQRTMHIFAGTRGVNTCADYLIPGKCAVLADLLGDAVVWFAMVPMHTDFKVAAPPIVDLLEGGYALLQNGWVIKVPDVVERRCPQETESLTDFRRRFGAASISLIDVSVQRLTAVQCSSLVTASG